MNIDLFLLFNVVVMVKFDFGWLAGLGGWLVNASMRVCVF
jgi:hypothetical protein